jgi:transposase InsO family protein
LLPRGLRYAVGSLRRCGPISTTPQRTGDERCNTAPSWSRWTTSPPSASASTPPVTPAASRRSSRSARASVSNFGRYGQASAAGLVLRHDHGSQFLSHVYQAELRFLGIRSSPAFLREPEGNGCTERFIRTLKEQLLWVERFDTIEDLRQALLAFKDRYNHDWLIARHGHRSPAAARASYAALIAA